MKCFIGKAVYLIAGDKGEVGSAGVCVLWQAPRSRVCFLQAYFPCHVKGSHSALALSLLAVCEGDAATP